MRNYRPAIHALCNDRIDEITYILRQYDAYHQDVASGTSRARFAQYRLDTIEAAAQAIGCPDLIPVCCKKAPSPRTAEFNRARRAFYLYLDQIV